MASRIGDGRAFSLLDGLKDNPSFSEWGHNDVTYIMELFALVRALKALFHVPPGTWQEIRLRDRLGPIH